MATEVKVEADPADAGFDGARLRRIDRHFARYVDDGLLPGYLAVVSRHGRIVHVASHGARDVEAGAPVETGTIWRIFSMTKPVTSVAAMTFVEEGLIDLTDPISRWLPEFAEPRVYAKGSALAPVTEPATEPIRLWHLLSHTAGLTYGFHHTHPVDALYRAGGYEWGTPPGLDLAECAKAWARFPLVFQPGAEWNYSVASDVLGRLVEVLAGKPLDEVFAERIFGPLGMTDTGFWTSDTDRLAALYLPAPGTKKLVRNDAFGAVGTSRPACLSGGGGLVSTAADYHRFTQMLLRRGELDGVRVLSPRTVDLMTANHLPGHVDLESYGRPLFAEMPFDGYGFGLGFSVLIDSVKAKTLATPGEYAWGGAASTAFWVDPDEDLTVAFYTQLLPSSTHPIRQQLRQLVYQAMLD
ncbi:beta-lactamase family protein [Amycolatopsis rubida]|uniref:Beta-lactamase family protein n=1 Tax=Amycolatopsis rubida TaxID=112413 RepID=A0ABX0CA60_9PSEU|nr:MULTISPECIES: serine hydrolase domain-containing protein [Amycolatopsis]MYW96858.1 serine hydrolase [Amycolatopsis rubida]NEC61843.1 beta-lactamase family protein [Amycolatopsis rubida]OAP23668.1 Esterase EstB [Amycolatopsis sp. M39]